MARGQDFTVTDQLFILDRNDYREECYFTFSYSPAPADDGSIGGVLVTALETTDRVLNDRRRRALRDLATELSKTHSEEDVWHAAATTLVSDPLTVPFAAIYSYDSTERRARLVASAGGISAAMCPAVVDLKSTSVWPFNNALMSSAEFTVGDLLTRFADGPPTSWGLPPEKAAILPIMLREYREPVAFLVAGISPRREFDDPYRQFLQRSGVLNSWLTLLKNTVFARSNSANASEPTDLATFTADLASSFRSAIEKAGLGFAVQCEPLVEPVYVDRDMWEKIVLNLLSNAFKFTFEGAVTVSLKPLYDSVELAVRDTGVGIAEADQARIFERFHRVEHARARNHEGTGMGLSLVHELVRLHGGSVRVESASGRGSIFTVTIPPGTAHLPTDRIGADRTLVSTALSADAYVQEAERWLPHADGTAAEAVGNPLLSSIAPSPGAASYAEKDLIVIADDNADMRDYLAHLLSEHFHVHAVANGQQAVEAVQQLHPSLVLADVMMPGLDGFGMLSAIRTEETLKSIPVILL